MTRLQVKIFFSLLLCSNAMAMGSKPQDPAPPPANAVMQAKPFRYVDLAKVTVPSFYLPNGVRADLNADLATIIDTQVNQSRYFRTQNAHGSGASHSRLIMTGGITSFELDVLQLNLKIGWNQSGAIVINPGVPGAEGELDFRLSNFSMDFKVYDAQTGQSYVASYTDASLSNLKFTIKANVSDITTTLQLITKMKIADTVRKATNDAVKRLENSSNFDLIPWEAHVTGIDLTAGTLNIDAGQSAGVLKNQAYSIYTDCNTHNTNPCYERLLADIKISNNGPTSSTGVPLSAQDSLQSIYVGDKAYVKALVSTSGK